MYEQILTDNFLKRRELLKQYLDTKGIAISCCPCCGYPTLEERGSYEICLICNWEDDDQDDDDADQILGGPNGNISLETARRDFEQGLINFENNTGLFRITHAPKILNRLLLFKNKLERYKFDNPESEEEKVTLNKYLKDRNSNLYFLTDLK